MSATRVAAGPGPTEVLGDALSRLPRRPAEGWLTVIAALVMVTAFAASLVDSGWTERQFAGDPGFLLYIGGVGVLWGLLGAKLGWGRWRTHVIGALLAGLILPLIAGGLVLEAQGTPVGWDPFGLAQRIGTAWTVAYGVWTDLAVSRLPFTLQEGHYHMIFGAMVFGAGMLTGFTVFGHRRPLDAVVVVGLALLANMAMTGPPHDHMPFLVAFSAAALVLLIRTHVFDEEITWARRKIGDPAAVGKLYLNGGVAFIVVAILGSILLTGVASSKPLQGLWLDLPKHLAGLSAFLQAIAPGAGDRRPFGVPTFGGSATSSGQWNPSNAIAFQAQIPAGETATFKWRAGTYAVYDDFTWSWFGSGSPTTANAPANVELLATAADRPDPDGRRPITISISPDAYRDATIVAPNTIESVDRATVARTIGRDGWFTTVESTEDVGPYNVTALIPLGGDVPGALTQARLRAAGDIYPTEIQAIYLQLKPDALGPAATRLLDTIKERVSEINFPEGVDPDNAYDLAKTMEQYLSDPANFTYDPDILEERRTCGPAVSTVECFALIQRGYCEYYAGAMVAMLRKSNVPARVAYGFLSGERDESSNVEVVKGSLAHWWVEVYFPDIGWVEFDPTGQVGQPVALPSGSIGPATPRPSRLPASFRPPSSSLATLPPSAASGGVAGAGPFIAIAVILLIGIGALAYAAVRRGPRTPMHPDQAWGSLAGLASRFGLGPRPSQTVYEYAGALGDEVPAARVELTTIARAKVEVAYGRANLGTDRLKRIAQAYQRLRLAILSVVVRRGLRRFGRGRRRSLPD